MYADLGGALLGPVRLVTCNQQRGAEAVLPPSLGSSLGSACWSPALP